MTTRAYDYILTLDDSSLFANSNIVVGLQSNTVAEIIAKEQANLKVKLSNNYYEFIVGESLVSNSAILLSSNSFIDHSANITGTTNTFALPVTGAFADAIQVYADGKIIASDSYILNDNDTITFKSSNLLVNSLTGEYAEQIFPSLETDSLLIQVVTGNTQSQSFVASNLIQSIETANANITAIAGAPYIAEKNSIQQTPLVRLYSIYYPGEWYPANANNNPGQEGAGYPWPHNFPIRYAEVLGETYSDFNYSVVFKGETYKVVALSSSSFSVDASSTINSIGLEIANFDGNIANIVENKNLLGFSSNYAIAYKNGEELLNIDPRTVAGNVHYDASIVSIKGPNAALTYEDAVQSGDTWTSLIRDSRDLLGAVVEIKSTYAKFLDFWPEYSIVKGSNSNSIQLYSVSPYRIGDLVADNVSSNTSTIVDIRGSNVYLNDSSLASIPNGSRLYIVNPDADSHSYVENTFVIDNLSELDELRASFSLTSWFQYLKREVPKRKCISGICPWKYKGKECKYSGSGTIVNSNPPIQANGFFTYRNESTSNAALDVCSKTFTACSLRNNLINFGGFESAREE